MLSLFVMTFLVCIGTPESHGRCGEISPPQTYSTIGACEAIAPDVGRWLADSIAEKPAVIESWTCGPAPGRDL